MAGQTPISRIERRHMGARAFRSSNAAPTPDRRNVMQAQLPALCLIAVPGRRRHTIELCQETERRGFAGIFSPSMFGNMSLCEALAWNTDRMNFGTAIAPIYARTVGDFAQSAAFMHEISGGRFRMGIGVAHGPSHVRMGVTPGKPLGDTRNFVERFRPPEGLSTLPP